MKDIVLSVRREYFGLDWVTQNPSAPARFKGTIRDWKHKGNHELYILWEGTHGGRCTGVALSQLLGVDEDGESVDCILEEYADGLPAPTYREPVPTRTSERNVRARAEEAVPGQEDDEPDEEIAEDVDAAPSEVNVKGRTWRKLRPDGVREDQRRGTRQHARLRPQGVDKSDIRELFEVLLPSKWLKDQVRYTNAKLTGTKRYFEKTNEKELRKWWGLTLALTLYPGVPVDDAWSSKTVKGRLAAGLNFGRFGMPLQRYKNLRSRLSFGPEDESSFESDPWCFMSNMVRAFNEHMEEVLEPGWLIALDECMSAWRGQVGQGDPDKCPHRMYLPRKPESLGAELYAAACAMCGMLIRLEVTEGAERNLQKEYFRPWKHTTAVSLRLAKPWHGTGRVVAGDAWFAGVRTAGAFLEHGLYFIGDVKKNTAEFPKEALEQATGGERGAWATYETVYKLSDGEEKKMCAVSHRRGGEVHSFIMTAGTTLPGHAHKATAEDDGDRYTHQVDHVIERKCCRVLNDFTLAQPIIDRHNRYRQFILAMEKRVLSNRFCLRLAVTLMGMVFVNSFFALRAFGGDETVDFRAEMEKLALYLLEEESLDALSPSGSSRASSPSTSTPGCANHVLVPLKSLGNAYKGCRQQKCNVCNHKTSWVCAACTTGADHLFPLCPEVTRCRGKGGTGHVAHHKCLAEHRSDPTWIPRGKRARKAKRAAQAEPECSECDSE